MRRLTNRRPRLDGDTPYTQSAENASAATTATLLSAVADTNSAGGPGHCSTTAIKSVTSGRFLPGDELPSPGGEPRLGLRVLGELIPDFDSCPDQAASGFWISPNLVDSEQTFDNWFTFPRAAIGMGRVIQLLHKDVTGKLCPLNAWGKADCQPRRAALAAGLRLPRARW